MKIENKNINENENLEKMDNNQESSETISEDLDKFAEEVINDIESSSKKAVEGSVKNFKSSIEAIGGEEEKIEEGTNLLNKINEEIETDALEAKKSVEEIYEGKSEVRNNKIKNDYSPEELDKLRKIKKEEYGDSLVKEYHKGAETLEEHETAQLKAYEALQVKVDAGIVKPDSIGTDMLNYLDLREKESNSVENTEEMMTEINNELNSFIEKGFINQEEKELIFGESEKFLNIYKEAYPDADLNKMYSVVNDNSRKLAYQTERDKQVFSGSDHGTRHILEGNMNMADKMLESLGDKVSAKDKVIVHQIIIDHDLGYTVGVAQAEKSFNASKDHPLFSTKFVEDNKDYYIDKFGEDVYEAIKDGILQHSYVKSEYGTSRDEEKGFNYETIRSITSTVDALGVTAEIKCPAFFREPAAVEILQKIKLYSDTNEEGLGDEQMDKYKKQLHAIADKEPSAKRKESFHNAIDNQFNSFTVDTTLGQYTGVMKDVKIEEKNGKLVPRIKMDISRAQALLGDFFGDKLAFKSFIKAMEDFNMPKDIFTDMAEKVSAIRETEDPEKKEKLIKELEYSQDNVIFDFSPDFSEGSSKMDNVFSNLEKLSVRGDINKLLRNIEKQESVDSSMITDLTANLMASVGEKLDEEDMVRLIEIRSEIISNAADNDKLKESLKKLKYFRSKKEKDFMNIN